MVTTFIAVNQTVSDIDLVQLALTVPGSGQINLTDFNTVSEIQSDAQLLSLVTAGSILINDGSSTLTLAQSLQYLAPVASKSSLIDVEAGADVTDWTNISAALDGYAGAANLIFRTDGYGSGYMAKNVQIINHRLTVGKSGDVDYTSLADAIQYAIDNGAGVIDEEWEIQVYPGTYTEPPMTVCNNINIIGSYSSRITEANIVASNPNEDLFTCTAGVITGLFLSGVTDPSKCLIRCATPNSLVVLYGIAVNTCSTGIYISDGATVIMKDFEIIIKGINQEVTTGIHVTGLGTYLGINGGFFACSSAYLPAYSINPIDKCVHISDYAETYITNIVGRVSYKNANADIFFVETDGHLVLLSSEISNSGNAVHIGSTGVATKATVQGVTYTNNLLNYWVESSTGVVSGSFSTDIARKTLVAGAKLNALVQYRTDNTIKLLGETKYQFTTTKEVDLADYFYDFISIGLCEDGYVTAGAGLTVNVSSGEGFVRRSLNEDAYSVEWDGYIGLPLYANQTNYVYYSNVLSRLDVKTTPTGSEEIQLATVITDGTGIRFLHDTRLSIVSTTNALHNYLLETRKTSAVNGLTTTQGSTPTKIVVEGGSYYVGLSKITVDGYAGDATFSYFYGTNGATEVTNRTQLDDGYYDKTGTLTALSDGYFKVDTVYITSDNRVSVIYGTTQYASGILAEVAENGNVPTFIEPSACSSARIIIGKNSGISQVIDARPFPAAGSTSGGAGGVGVHSALAGLLANDHPQYLQINGTASMAGDLDMANNSITNVNTVDGVDVSTHASRHNPGGLDALSTAAPIKTLVGSASAIGSASSFALSDHQHGIDTGTPSTINTTNQSGSSSSAARLDHIHAHGNQTDGYLHAIATSTVAGFLSAADKAKLDTFGSGDVVITVRNETGSPLLKGRCVAITGNTLDNIHLVGYADYNDPNLRPSIGILQSTLNNNTTGFAVVSGELTGLDTSLYALTDQLVLGPTGTLIRPPPENTSFVGEIQNVASVSFVSATDGRIIVSVASGMNVVTGDYAFALQGTDGYPSNTNRYVTDSDPRNINSRTPTYHASSHLPNGLDSLTTAASISTAVQIDNTASTGSANSFARSDHTHTVVAGSPVAVGTANADGNAVTFARANHVHAGLTREANDFNTFALKSVPSTTDILLIEDSGASGVKKHILFGNITDGYALHKNISDEINVIAEKVTPVTSDVMLIEDSADGYSKKKVYINKLPVTDSNAIHKTTSNEINALTIKTTPSNSDVFVIEDSADGYSKKKLLLGNITRNTMVIQEGGVSLANTPHSIINAGSGITATDDGPGTAIIALDTYPPIGDSTTKPAAPATGTLLFSKFRAGRRMTAQIGPTGMDFCFQPAIFANKIGYLGAQGNSTTTSVINFGATTTGSVNARNVATTSFFTTIRRLGLDTANGAGSSAGIRHNLLQFFSGNGAGIGGFFFVARFGINTTNATYRWFVGLSGTSAAFGNANPSSLLNLVGLGIDSGDANIQFMYNDGAGTATKIDLGASWPKPTAATQFYEFRLFIAPNTTTYYWSLENLVPGSTALIEGDTSGTTPTNIPSNTTLLSPQVWINNGANAGIVGIDVSSLYIETDN